ncbi:ion channel [Hymenobacter sp. BT491]|uniref:ion channel n=1 Tax=Hymenobacter sp. BT491 TaxID=2766779 RepID=UPI001653A9B5|nr:ion channel [Hymenobacter sp. BT491]MBC6992523.1 hypothetical protein [Hymenobacter sp. BT491]
MFRPLSARLTETLDRWQDRGREPALTALLLGQGGVLFVAGPLLSLRLLNFAVMDGLQVLLLLIASFALPRGSPLRVLILGCVGLITGMLMAAPNPHVGLLLHTVATLGITLGVGQAVFRARRVTRHQLLGAVVVYLNLALLFVGAYDSLNVAFPGAFATATHTSLQRGELVYFSLTALTSTGYGSLCRLTKRARSLANLEAVVGQLFLAILLARLVSLHSEP